MAGKAANGFLKLIGLSMGDDDVPVEEVEVVREEPVRPSDVRRVPAYQAIDVPDDDPYLGARIPSRGGNVVQHPGHDVSQHCVMFYTMATYADTSYAIDDLLRGRSVHVNLDEVDQGVAQRILDTLSGASYALHGDHKQTAKHSYFFAPQEIQLSEGGEPPQREAPRSRAPYRRGE